MKTLIAGVALATILAFPAFAQSYDPDLGTGNLVQQYETPAVQSGAAAAHAQLHIGAAHRGNAQETARLQSPRSAYAAVTPFGSPTASQNGANAHNGANATKTREVATRECSIAAAPYKEMTWGTMQIQTFRSCMAQHGQPE